MSERSEQKPNTSTSTISEVDSENKQSGKPSQKNMVSLELKARNKMYELSIKKITNYENISKDIDHIIDQISISKTFKPEESVIEEKTSSAATDHTIAEDDPIHLLSLGLDVDYENFKKLKLITIKNDNIQILKPSMLKPSENTYLILAANEFGLHKKSMQYEEWKNLCEASNIKSNTTFANIVKNAKNYGHIDKQKYDASKELILTGKGLEIVKESINKLLNGN